MGVNLASVAIRQGVAHVGRQLRRAGAAGQIWRRLQVGLKERLPQAEWGGYKQSGIGRELGKAGLEEYRETKHVWHNTRPAPQRWFGG